MHNGRQRNGRFADGNPGGPGRPPRALEGDYLAALADGVPLERWRRIVERAVADAEAGDPRARDWLARNLGLDAARGKIEIACHLPIIVNITDADAAHARECLDILGQSDSANGRP